MRRQKLNHLARYCHKNVPFYRELFERNNVEVEEVFDVDGLRRCGVATSKRILRESKVPIFSRGYDRETLLNSSTSGSTGEPFLVHMSYDAWCRRMALKYRSEDWFGKPIGTPTTIIWGHKPGLSGLAQLKEKFYWRFQNYRFLSAFKVGEESLIEYLGIIRKCRSRFLESYVTVVYELARVIDEKRLEPPKLDGIVIGAERLFDFQRDLIEKSFNCPVYNRYGSTEFSNIASECDRREGLHINSDCLWVEVVDEDDRPVVGKPGQIVVTDLHNYAMPLIRYRTGDVGVMSAKRCSCGRNFPMLEDVMGRASDTLVTEDGRKMHDMFFLWKLSRVPGIDRFQVVQDSLNHIYVNIVHDGSVEPESTSQGVKEALEELAEFNISIDTCYVDDIPVSRMGKTSFFRSDIGKDRVG
ncbi:MAG: hypothetical protein GF417_06500 [Candidatus Latescibacteria bacterium]|nr:hypothetical protein [bacterium]MBD3424067.1 hypothetical protein [Candidatus Latescibacterota bacterium]